MVILVVLVVLMVLVVLVVLVVSVFLVVSVVMAPKGKSKPLAKLAAKRMLESNKDTDVEEITLAKHKRSSITALKTPKPAQPALSFCLSALLAHSHRLPSNALAALLTSVCKIVNF